jgi:hypothetical protein
MKTGPITSFLIICHQLLLASTLQAAVAAAGELAGWGETVTGKLQRHLFALRYLPEMKAAGMVDDRLKWDVDVAGRFEALMMREGEGRAQERRLARFYRLWGRLSRDKSELRLGLQKLNFGPAKVLRSLQWFDQVDPKDPTQFTLGVIGGLWRQYFDNNGNIWIWTLYGNKEPMGPLPLTGDPHRPEYGGRVQYPLLAGEMGLSLHQRRVTDSSSMSLSGGVGGISVPESSLNEQRIAFDGVWDIGVGVWFEAAMIHMSPNPVLPQNFITATLGSDYTLGLGNGLYFSAEAMMHQSSSSGPARIREDWLIAVAPSYPLNLLDQLRLVAITSLPHHVGNYYAELNRRYDDLLVALGLFYNEFSTAAAAEMTDIVSQKPDRGVRFVIQYNH